MSEIVAKRGPYRNTRKPGPKLKLPSIHFEWHKHNDNGLVRVWRSDWFSDQFEILNQTSFDEFNKWAKRFSFVVREAGDE